MLHILYDYANEYIYFKNKNVFLLWGDKTMAIGPLLKKQLMWQCLARFGLKINYAHTKKYIFF